MASSSAEFSETNRWFAEAEAHADAFLRGIGGATALDAEAAQLRAASRAFGAVDDLEADCSMNASVPLAGPGRARADDCVVNAVELERPPVDGLHSIAEGVATAPRHDAATTEDEGAGLWETGEEEAEEEGEEERMMSCEGSDGGEWQLERILAMRSVRRPERRREFLCQWRWYAAPAWEPEAALVDLGFDVELARYLAAARAAPLAATQSADVGDVVAGVPSSAQPPAVPGDDEDAQQPARPAAANGTLRTTIFERLYPDWYDFICAHLAVHGAAPVALANVAPAYATARLLELWRASCVGDGARGEAGENGDGRPRGRVVPVRVFHGTAARNIPSICANGLAVPGTMGVTVQNGQVYGRGIYASKTVAAPLRYGDGHGFLLVCVGLQGAPRAERHYQPIPSPRRKRQPDEFVVFPENSHVVPVWLVQMQRVAGLAHAPTCPVPRPPVAAALLAQTSVDDKYEAPPTVGPEKPSVAGREAHRSNNSGIPSSVALYPGWREMLHGTSGLRPLPEPEAHVDNTAAADVAVLRSCVIDGRSRPAQGQSVTATPIVRRFGRAADGQITKRMLKQMPRSVRETIL